MRTPLRIVRMRRRAAREKRKSGGSALLAAHHSSGRLTPAVAAGTEVALEPSGHAVPVRFNGEMPAELVPRWLFSHLEADGRAHIMSEPARIGDEHFPLFYFCGTVPAAALKPRNA